MTPFRRVWITRSDPGSTGTAARLSALGFEPLGAPLLAIRALQVPAPDLDGISALAFTSRNGVDAFARLTQDRHLPVFTVGDATAEAARAVGFSSVRSAAGALGDLARLLAAEGPRVGTVLLPGALEPSGDIAALLSGHIEIRALPLYEAVATRARPPAPYDAVLVHSPRAGRALATLGPFEGQTAVVISPAAAAPLTGLTGLEIRVASRPDETALLAALGKPLRRV